MIIVLIWAGRGTNVIMLLREGTNVNIVNIVSLIIMLYSREVTFMSMITMLITYQGGHKRNGSYEGVDSNEPPQVKMMTKIVMNDEL